MKLKNSTYLYWIFLLPSLAGVMLFYCVPFLYSFYYAFIISIFIIFVGNNENIVYIYIEVKYMSVTSNEGILKVLSAFNPWWKTGVVKPSFAKNRLSTCKPAYCLIYNGLKY
jgi:ABC-type sugar transport system permease subunit